MPIKAFCAVTLPSVDVYHALVSNIKSSSWPIKNNLAPAAVIIKSRKKLLRQKVLLVFDKIELMQYAETTTMVEQDRVLPAQLKH